MSWDAGSVPSPSARRPPSSSTTTGTTATVRSLRRHGIRSMSISGTTGFPMRSMMSCGDWAFVRPAMITITARSSRLPPQNRSDYNWSAFGQDKVTLLNDKLLLTFGSKIEHNDYTGVEVQPSVRLLYGLRKNHALWWAVSRAVRTPSRIEEDVRINERR